jgi:hypothetical protein
VFARGTIVSGVRGKRIEVNPGITYLPEIRFYPSLNESLFSYINSFDLGAGTVPTIGMNAPDTGATGQAVVLFDFGFQVGEINKSLGELAGPGLQALTNGSAGILEFFGKVTNNPGTTLGLMYSNKYVVPINVTNVTITKIGTPASGEYLPFITMWRNTTTLFQYHLNVNNSTQYTIQMGLHATLATVVHDLMIRMN